MPYVGNKPEVGNFRKCDAITTSATATYNLLVGGVAVNPNQNQCIVSLNGVIQSSGNSYTIASSQITFASTLASSDVIDFILILGDTLDVGVPSDDTVGLAQLSATGSPSSSNFLRGDNSWAVAGTTINNNADNRVITGSGTANTLEGEANLTYDGTTLLLSQASPILKVLPTTNGNDGVIELCGRSTDGSPTENRTQIKGEAEGSTANTKMTFHVENASGVNERMSIGSGGQVSIGTTETDYANLQQADDNGIILTSGSGSIIATNTDVPLVIARSNGDSASRDVVIFGRGGVTCGSITSTPSATSYVTSSDYRLKENEVAISDGIERLKQLKPYRFNFKADTDKTVDGFFAHEVSSIVPEAITGEKDAVDENDKIISQGIDQSKLVPLLTSALQEAITKIETLETKVTALENK
jgi:hypothetical protein